MSASTPRVSICVPNLNTRPFLPERFATIAAQTFQDWELLVYDSYSEDGAWEYIQQVAAGEPRMRVWQGPREGAPGAWNPCLKEARGEYVYIATSDDTMPPDCLEKLVAALDAHPECDLAHCPLRPIDEEGRDVAVTRDWWTHAAFAESSGPLLHHPHVRKAPFDGLLHLLGGPVYVSITQLLIRRSLFHRIGLFSSEWGSVGDFHWTMRASLVANAVHVPDTWGGWRLHGGQATAAVNMSSPEHHARIDAMIEDAINASVEFLHPTVRKHLMSHWMAEARELRTFVRRVAMRRQLSMAQRWGFTIWRLLLGSAAARAYVRARVLHQPLPSAIRRQLHAVGYSTVLVPVRSR